MSVTFRAIVRLMALCLLLFAAADLVFAGTCADASAIDTGRTVLSAGEQDDGGPEHAGEDCYCCSRTVRAEGTARLTPAVGPLVTLIDSDVSLLQHVQPPAYHPPLV